MKLFTLIGLLMLSVQALASTSVFKMYTVPHAQPNRNCDVHVSLKLEINGDVARATVKNALSGFCEIYIIPNERTYTLTGTPDNCGAMVFKNQAANVAIIDNRSNTCEMVLPALIIMKEAGNKFYSQN